jgi:hypothetical protein
MKNQWEKSQEMMEKPVDKPIAPCAGQKATHNRKWENK